MPRIFICGGYRPNETQNVSFVCRRSYVRIDPTIACKSYSPLHSIHATFSAGDYAQKSEKSKSAKKRKRTFHFSFERENRLLCFFASGRMRSARHLFEGWFPESSSSLADCLGFVSSAGGGRGHLKTHNLSRTGSASFGPIDSCFYGLFMATASWRTDMRVFRRPEGAGERILL